MQPVKLDHCVISCVGFGNRSHPFYREVLGAELVSNGTGWAYRFRDVQLNFARAGVQAARWRAYRSSRAEAILCFEWQGRSVKHKRIWRRTVFPSELGRSAVLAYAVQAPASTSETLTARCWNLSRILTPEPALSPAPALPHQ